MIEMLINLLLLTLKVSNFVKTSFSSAADKTRWNIPPANHHSSNSFLRDPNLNSIFFSMVSQEEVIKFINSFSTLKSTVA